MSDIVTFNVGSRTLKNIGESEDEVKLSDGYYHFLRENRNGAWSHYFHGSGIYSVDSLGRTIYDPEQATIVSLYNGINVLDNPRGNHIWTSDTFDTLRLVNYFAVEDYLGE